MDILITLGATIGIIIGIILLIGLWILIVYLDDKYGFVIPVIYLSLILFGIFCGVHNGLVESGTIEPFLDLDFLEFEFNLFKFRI